MAEPLLSERAHLSQNTSFPLQDAASNVLALCPWGMVVTCPTALQPAAQHRPGAAFHQNALSPWAPLVFPLPTVTCWRAHQRPKPLPELLSSSLETGGYWWTGRTVQMSEGDQLTCQGGGGSEEQSERTPQAQPLAFAGACRFISDLAALGAASQQLQHNL